MRTNFGEIASSHSKTLFCAVDVTIAINTNREIEITIAIGAPTLLSMCQNSYYQIVTLISLFCPFRYKHVPLFYHDICSFFYSGSNTSEILQLYALFHFRSYYKYTSANMNFIVVLIKLFSMGTKTN